MLDDSRGRCSTDSISRRRWRARGFTARTRRHWRSRPKWDAMSEPDREGRLHQGSGDPGLFACLYRPPLPGQFIVPPDTAGAVDVDASTDRAPRGERWSAAAISPHLPASPPSPTSPLVATSPLVTIAAEFSPRYEQHR